MLFFSDSGQVSLLAVLPRIRHAAPHARNFRRKSHSSAGLRPGWTGNCWIKKLILNFKLILKFFRANILITAVVSNILITAVVRYEAVIKIFALKNFKINIHQNVSRAFNILHYNNTHSVVLNSVIKLSIRVNIVKILICSKYFKDRNILNLWLSLLCCIHPSIIF